MNINTRIYKVSLVILAAVLFFASAQVQNVLNVDRKDLGLTKLPPLQNAPPVLAFSTIALGGFRGLIANALWMRATDLQDQDKYFEMVQLADWITELEPHFVAVWTVQAWNMAYNISVKFKDPEDRWHWVERGVALLRDRGIPMNPDDALMYRELAWFYQHKIGQDLDDANMRYKLRLAQQMQAVLGTGRPDFAVLINPKTAEDRERVRKLREIYKLDPKVMQMVDQTYGPLDWRLPDAHAIYWATLGLEKSTPKDQETLRRVIFQSMRAACLRGGALPDGLTNITARNFMLWPNLDLMPKVNDAYNSMIAAEKDPSQKKSMENGHKNFLSEGVYLLYEDNRMNQANYWFNYWTNMFSNALYGRPGHTLDDYAVAEIVTDNNETDKNRVTASIRAMYHRAFECLVMGDDARYFNYEALAQKVWNHYTRKIGEISAVRIGLPKTQKLRQDVLDRELDPQNGWMPPVAQAILRTKLGLPPPKATGPVPASSSQPPTSRALIS